MTLLGRVRCDLAKLNQALATNQALARLVTRRGDVKNRSQLGAALLAGRCSAGDWVGAAGRRDRVVSALPAGQDETVEEDRGVLTGDLVHLQGTIGVVPADHR